MFYGSLPAGVEMRPFWEKAGCIAADREAEDRANGERSYPYQLRAGNRCAWWPVIFSRLSRDEMRYVLDPGDILGRDCGFETFGALMRAEFRAHKAFVTRNLILTTWDSLP